MIAERYHREHAETFMGYDIDFDIFSRTGEPGHSENAGRIFLDLLEKGYLEERTMTSPYCVSCDRFLADRYVEGTCPNCGFVEARGDQCDNCGKILDPKDLIRPRCRISHDEPEFRETKHFFFLMDRIQEELLRWFDGKKDWRQNVQSFTRNFISGGLKPRPVTRDIEWGVPVPVKGYEKKRIYVWFEALIGYLSAAKMLSEMRGDLDLWKRYWQDPETRTYYFMGKDNITFHSVIWPSVILAHGELNLPYDIPANEYLNLKEGKFSKSRGVGFGAGDALRTYHRDYLRYYLASILPETGDSEFSFAELREKVNSELISKYGNLVHRLTTFTSSRSISLTVPESLDQASRDAIRYARECIDAWKVNLEAIEIKKGLRRAMELIQYANSFFNQSRPWDLVKTSPESAREKLWVIGHLIASSTVMLYPFVPSSAEHVWKVMGLNDLRGTGLSQVLEGKLEIRPEKSDPPFQLIPERKAPKGPYLVVGKVEAVENHPEADRLFLLKVNLGERKISLVAGLRKHYPPERVLGRKIVVVANLKHTKIRGHVSEGMLLAADDGKRVRFLTVDDSIAPGTEVSIGGTVYADSGEITIDDLMKFGLVVKGEGNSQAAFSSRDGKDHGIAAEGTRVFPEEPVSDGALVR